MNIVFLNSDNLPGLKNILVFNAARVVSAGERPVGNNVNTPICHYADSPATFIEGIRESVGFYEETVVVDGVPGYKSTFSCIIPKNRPELITQFMNWTDRRFICLARDNNGNILMLGTRNEPAQFFLNRRVTGAQYDQRNEMELEFTVI